MRCTQGFYLRKDFPKLSDSEADLVAYNVTDREGKDAYWNRIGRCFPFETKDGRAGFRIPSLNLVILPPKPDEEPGPDSAAEENGA